MAQLDTAHFAADTNLVIADPDEAISAMAEMLEDVLVLHDTEFTGQVVTYLDDQIDAKSAETRDAIMKDPARYCELWWLGDAGYGPDAGGAQLDRAGRFPVRLRMAVAIYYGVTARGVNAEDLALAASTFRLLMGQVGVYTGGAWITAPGVLDALRQQGYVITDTDSVELGIYIEPAVAVSFVNPGGSGSHRWESLFIVQLT